MKGKRKATQIKLTKEAKALVKKRVGSVDGQKLIEEFARIFAEAAVNALLLQTKVKTRREKK